MIFKIRIGHWRFTWTMAPVTNVIGVNSRLPNGNHILMWDFDHTTLNYVTEALIHIQNIYALPNIYILQTKAPNIKLGELHEVGDGSKWQTADIMGNYIAYCFYSCSWRRCIEIIATTKGTDPNFFKYGVYRGRFTLRVTPKSGRKPKLVWTLKGYQPENATIQQLKSWVKYETLTDNFKPKKVSLNEPKNT